MEENITYKLEIIQLIESSYGIEIRDEEIETILSFEDLINMVRSKNRDESIFFRSYEDYKQYVTGEWEQGAINELFEDGLILEVEESFEYECARKEVKYRYWSEQEFNIKLGTTKLK